MYATVQKVSSDQQVETAVGLPASGAYRLAPTRSSVKFRVRKLGLFVVRGSFSVHSGHALVTSEGADVHAELDAASFTTASNKRNSDVRGPRFLDIAQYPRLRFAGRLDAGDAVIRGELSGHGTAAPLDLVVTALHTDAHRTEVRATATVDRTALGVTGGRGIAGRYLDVELCVTLVPIVTTIPDADSPPT